jgi:hypothetical protein
MQKLFCGDDDNNLLLGDSWESIICRIVIFGKIAKIAVD